MLDRRTLLGAGLTAPFVGIREAEAATALGQYVVLLGDGTGSAVDTATGFRLRGGAFDDPASGVRLFSRFTLPASGTVRYRLTREVIPPTVTSNGVWFNVGIVWGRNPTISNRIRLSTYPSRTQLAPREAKALANFQQGVANEVVLTWKGRVVSLAVPTLGAKAKQSWSNVALKVPATGARLMFYASFGGDYLVENVRLPA